jgi:hypothetical protein
MVFSWIKHFFRKFKRDSYFHLKIEKTNGGNRNNVHVRFSNYNITIEEIIIFFLDFVKSNLIKDFVYDLTGEEISDKESFQVLSTLLSDVTGVLFQETHPLIQKSYFT